VPESSRLWRRIVTDVGRDFPDVELEYGLGRPAPAARIRRAVDQVLAAGWRTADLAAAGGTVVGTRRMGELVVLAMSAEP
jgi:isocitrate/isopropylmalate dehydrogenase